MIGRVFDDRVCALGEGPFWHKERAALFWFDILGQKLLARGPEGPREWAFDEMVSAAGIVAKDELLIASESALFRFHLETGARTSLVALEAENAATRSNDGRADPQGGFWIGTMAKKPGPGPGAGAIYRYHRGELRRLFGGIAIPNAICFAPDGQSACFTDTVTGQVLRVALDSLGWPKGAPEVFLDLRAEKLNPDGAVMDQDGALWLAEWGAARVSAYGPDGQRLRSVAFDAPHTSCPAFGGPEGRVLFCTSATLDMPPSLRAAYPHAGKTFTAKGLARGQTEHQVILP